MKEISASEAFRMMEADPQMNKRFIEGIKGIRYKAGNNLPGEEPNHSFLQ
jgi:hypothetical protein